MSWKIGFAFICLMFIALGIAMFILEIKYSKNVKGYSLKVKRKDETEPIEVRAAYEQKAYNKGYADGIAERRQARWKGAGMGDYMCSLCNIVVSGNRYHYCPNCGARMDGGENER